MSRENLFHSPLKNVVWQAVIDGPLMSYTSSQHYHNDSQNPIEINYSFPLPYGKSVISKFRANINGVVREGKAYPKKEAEQKYEDAIESGDSPIMLEITEKDFCTASLGNILPGEDAAIELEYLQLVDYCRGRLRITIPTVIGERYASDPEEAPSGRYEITHNLFANYDFEGSVLLKGSLATGVVSSPTHDIEVQRKGEDLVVKIRKAKLDSDLVLDIEAPLESAVYVAEDEGGWAALSNFILHSESSKLPLDLNILVDCSGSMEGSRIQKVRKVLRKLSTKLDRNDQVSLVSFGETAELKLLPNRMKFEEFEGDLAEAASHLEADLGGTELEQAIRSCMSLFPGSSKQSAMLLLTDGEVWDPCESMIKAAREGKRKIFILGIGLAPYSNLLVELAKETGGAYEAVYSWYDVEGAVERMITRIRSEVAYQPEVRWNAPKLWASEDEKSVFAEDSYSCFALLRKLPEPVELKWKEAGKTKRIETKYLKKVYGYELCQLVAAQRMLSADTEEEMRDIGVKYNIAGPETNFFLSIERKEGEKVDEMPELVVVPQMVSEDACFCYAQAPSANKVCSSCSSPSSHWHASKALPGRVKCAGPRPLDDDFEDEDFEAAKPAGLKALEEIPEELESAFETSDREKYKCCADTLISVFVRNFFIGDKRFVAIMEKIGEKLGYKTTFGDLPKGDLLEEVIAEVEKEKGASFYDFVEDDLEPELDREAFAELCIFIFFASLSKYEEIDPSFHNSFLRAIDRTIKA